VFLKSIRRGALLIISAAALGVSAPQALAAGEYEPNETYNTAAGPILSGGPISAGLETANDWDVYYFYVPQTTQLFFSVQNSGPHGEYICSYIERQYPSEVDDLYATDLSVEGGSTASGAITLERGKYYFNVRCGSTDEIGNRYSFTFTPAGVTTTYEPFAQQCAAAGPPVQEASATLNDAKARLELAKAKLAAARAAHKPKKVQRLKAKVAALKAEVKADQASYDNATAAQADACSVPQ
jgi:hypothetical protein